MKVLYNSFLPFRGYVAMMFFGVILARKRYRPLGCDIVRHEEIHKAQAKDCGGYLRYYFLYLKYWFKYWYGCNPFEKEAYMYMGEEGYLERREPMAWRRLSIN